MGGIDATTFMTKIRKEFRGENDFELWLNENLFYKTIKVLVKAKQENFKGEQRQRFYAVDVSHV